MQKRSSIFARMDAILVRITLASVVGLGVFACGDDRSSDGDSSNAGPAGSNAVNGSGSSTGSFSAADGGSTACSKGQTQSCWTGDPSERGKGACHDGVQQCEPHTSSEFTSWTWGACTGEQLDCATAGPPKACCVSPALQCDSSQVPETLKATVSGFVKCSCFNGTFTMSRGADGIWASAPITGCPGQTEDLYFKFNASPTPQEPNVGFAISNQASVPGVVGADCADVTQANCGPFQVSGGGSCVTSVTDFCGPGEDYAMTWTITP